MWDKSSHSNTTNNCLEWRKSTRRASMGDCAEVAPDVLVRDSKDPGGPVLGFSAEVWRVFISRLRIQ